MACIDRRENISALADNELHGKEYDELCRHLQDCCECREYLEKIKGISSQLAGLPQISPSVDFMEKIMQGIEKQESFSLAYIAAKIYDLCKNAFASPAFCSAILIALFLNCFISGEISKNDYRILQNPNVIKVIAERPAPQI